MVIKKCCKMSHSGEKKNVSFLDEVLSNPLYLWSALVVRLCLQVPCWGTCPVAVGMVVEPWLSSPRALQGSRFVLRVSLLPWRVFLQEGHQPPLV